MKRLLGILLVLVVAGCEDRSRPLPESRGTSSLGVAVSPAPVADAVAALEKLGAKIRRNEQCEFQEVEVSKITDAGLVHVARLAKTLNLVLFDTRMRG